MNFKKDLDEFVLSERRNYWFEYSEFKVYLRKSRRLSNSKVIPCLDLAAIEVYPDFQYQGIFSSIRLHLEYAVKYYYFCTGGLFVENIHNRLLYRKLLSYGYSKYDLNQVSMDLIKTK